jgi:hypothetical protein
MTSKMKCPFCGVELDKDISGEFGCPNEKCKKSMFLIGTEEMWQALIQAKQDLEQYEHKDNLQQQLNANNNQIQENYKQIVEIDEQIIENLEKDLQTAVQALKDIQTAQGRHWGATDTDIKNDCKYCARKALEQIEHKE